MKLFIAIAILLSVGCAPDSNPSNTKNIVGQQFLNAELNFNTNPYPMFIAMLQLEQPALLEKLITKNGKKVVDQELLKLINEEQESILNKLKNISPDIKVIYTYKRVMNGLTIVAPMQVSDQIENLTGIKSFEADQQFASPNSEVVKEKIERFNEKISTINSVNYIKANEVQKQISVVESVTKDGETKDIENSVMGQGVRVGIIDTGVDYTHSMLGGSGNVEDYKKVDTLKASDFFPNEKVVGGKDFVGEDFSTFTIFFDKFIPTPDVNPIDVGGHGTHVAGTVAGIGNNINTYSGVAPKADIYALKVFGDTDGGTSDSVVIAAFEYSVDPNEDFDLSDSLHVLNLSLGSGYGTPHQFYNYAISILTDFGTVVVASAGNSGDVDYITGSPGSSDDAISVAAGIDDMIHNWNFDAVTISGDEITNLKVKALEASFSVKIADIMSENKTIKESLVYIGEAKDDLNDQTMKRLKGKIALIDRGTISFTDKFKRAQDAGAIAVVVVNNTEAEPIEMGGVDESYEFKIPGIMITKAIGDQIKKGLETIIVDFTNGDAFEEPQKIGTITGFSSKGPRSLDSVLKPEITAPGQQIISAAVGTGTKGVKLNGTSMSAPHMAGVMALMKQKHKKLSARDLKSMVMGTAQNMYVNDLETEGSKTPYLLSRMGAGMVNALTAIQSPVAFYPHSISLGEHSLVQSKFLSKKIEIKNISSNTANYKLSYKGDNEIKISFEENNFELAPDDTFKVKLQVELEINSDSKPELNGHVLISNSNNIVSRVPILAIVNQASLIKLKSFKFNSDIVNSSQELNLHLSNKSGFDGRVRPYNLLALDDRKAKASKVKSSTCDIQAVGYRYTTKEIEEKVTVGDQVVTKAVKKDILQFAAKTFNPLTSWHQCVMTVEFDTDLDDEANYLLLSGRLDRIPFSISESDKYVSYLVDSKKRQKLIEMNLKDNQQGQTSSGITLDLSDALIDKLDATANAHSTIYEFEVDARLVGKLSKTAVRITMSNVSGSDIEESDVLIGGTEAWHYLSIRDKKEPYSNLPQEILVEKSSEKIMSLVTSKKTIKNPLMLLMPENKFNFSRNINDNQMYLVNP